MPARPGDDTTPSEGGSRLGEEVIMLITELTVLLFKVCGSSLLQWIGTNILDEIPG